MISFGDTKVEIDAVYINNITFKCLQQKKYDFCLEKDKKSFKIMDQKYLN